MMLRLVLALVVALWGLPAASLAQGAAPAFSSERIVVSVQGPAQGPDVILIPGLASTSEIWRATAARLDDRYRVHLVTVRGFGTVPAAANGGGEVIGPTADEVRRYIAERRLDRPAIIGHSLGGLVALRIAADGRNRIGRVMVVDSAPFFPALISEGATVGDVEPLAQIAYQALMFLGDDALRSQGAMLGSQLGGAADSLFNSVGWQGGNRATLAQSLYEVMTTDLRSRLPDITAPVTVVYGWSPDDASPRAHIDGLFRASYRNLRTPPRYEPVEGAEHMVMIDQPSRFMAAVNRFLS